MCGLVNIDSAGSKEECHFNSGPDTDDQCTNMQIFKVGTESMASLHCFYQVLQKPHHLRK